MDNFRRTRVLVVTDHPDGPPGLLEAIRIRAEQGPAQFRILVTNPAKTEAHLLHPERHDLATQAEKVLHASLPALAAAASAPVIGSVSIRHDPYLAVEELLSCEPVDEFIVDLAQNGFTRRLHLDLAHRLHHLGAPITNIQPEATLQL
jgi:hypothetical protein